jgi:catechol 2,3-dioxygenase-like lactoylglutathione lyase family enzyme
MAANGLHDGAAAGRDPVKVSRIIHTIHATRDIAACRGRYLDVLGGLIFAEGYFEPEDRDMALLYVADHMIEPMAPRDPARDDKAFARYLKRFGQGFHSFEIKVDNARQAAAKLKAAGCQLATEYDTFFFVRQPSTGGVLLEVCEIPMTNDPYDRRNWSPAWAEGLPSTLSRLDHIACVTADLDGALAFFAGALDGERLLDERVGAPQPGRRILVRLGDTRVAFIQPDDLETGALAAFLRAPNPGIYSLTWTVEDAAAAQAAFTAKGLRLTRDGCVSGGFAIEPEDFFGARHEFVQIERAPSAPV